MLKEEWKKARRRNSRVALEQTGLPDPQDGEVRSTVALGQPEEEGQDSPKRGTGRREKRGVEESEVSTIAKRKEET